MYFSQLFFLRDICGTIRLQLCFCVRLRPLLHANELFLSALLADLPSMTALVFELRVSQLMRIQEQSRNLSAHFSAKICFVCNYQLPLQLI